MEKIEKQKTSADVDKLLSDINKLQWFTDNMYTTSHAPCGACYTYYTTVVYKGQTKTVEAVDGGTDSPPNYWVMTAEFANFLPPFAPVP